MIHNSPARYLCRGFFCIISGKNTNTVMESNHVKRQV